jgi:catechol 2,3-dioxygenase-like lactoylglutathione lyase family enzyme
MSASDQEAAPPPPQFRSNSEVAVHVPDLGKAGHFYGEVLGFRLVSRTERQLEFDTGKLRLYVNLDSRPLHSYVPSLDVADREAAREYLEAAGCKPVPISSQPGLYYMRDPFGMVFDLVERRDSVTP